MRSGLPGPAYWFFVVLFLLSGAAMGFWIFLYARDAMVGGEAPVAGRFDGAASLRLTASCFASLALTSAVLLFAHYKRADHYGSPLELFFRIVFGLSCAMAVICFLPSLG